MTRVFSGIQPSGDAHLGNYLGGFRQYVALQADAECVYCIVDLHAVTSGHDPTLLRERVLDMAMVFLAAGVDPDDSILFVQSARPEHAQAAWLLNCVAGYGELGRMPQFREKSAHAAASDEQVSVGLFDYPVLQTADIILYHADQVPVGEDQRHHVELARDLARRFDHRFSPEDAPIFTLPEAIHPAAGARVMDLQDPTTKMSKSTSSEKGLVRVLDPPERIARKIRSAVTDSEPTVRYDREHKAGISNLLEIMSAATGRGIADLVAEYRDGGYGAFKTAVAEAVVDLLAPVRERHAELSEDPAEVERILATDAERAGEISAQTLERMFAAMGFRG